MSERRFAAHTAIAAFHEIERGRGSRGRIHPVARIGTAFAFLIALVSFGKYEFSEVAAMAVYPFALVCFEGVRIRDFSMRFWLALIPVVLVGAANPFFDRTTVAVADGVTVLGGWLSFAVLLLKGALALVVGWAVFRLVGADGIARAFAALRLPPSFALSFLLMHRHLVMMVKEVERMRDAYLLRSGTLGGALRPSAWGPFVGLLLMRSMDRAARVQDAVELRGGASGIVSGAGDSARAPMAGLCGWAYFCGWTAFFAIARYGEPMRRLGDFARRCIG